MYHRQNANKTEESEGICPRNNNGKSEESNLYNQDFSCYWHSRVYDNIPGNER